MGVKYRYDLSLSEPWKTVKPWFDIHPEGMAALLEKVTERDESVVLERLPRVFESPAVQAGVQFLMLGQLVKLEQQTLVAIAAPLADGVFQPSRVRGFPDGAFLAARQRGLLHQILNYINIHFLCFVCLNKKQKGGKNSALPPLKLHKL